MKILFLSQYYPPESNAPAVRTSELAERWVRAGDEVTVLTAFPHHPTGVIPPEYHGRIFQREERSGVRVVRTYVYVAPNKDVLRRGLSYSSWMFSAIVLGALRVGKADVLVATSPQFLCAVAGYVLSRLKRLPFVMEVRDLWPESIVAVGALKEGFLVEVLRRMERFLYGRARSIVVVSPGFLPHMESLGIRRDKIHVIPNGVDLDRFRPDGDGGDVFSKSGVELGFRILYSGTVGMAHGLEIVIEAGERLRDEGVQFVVIGEGARRKELADEVSRRRLTNVHFLPMQPRDAMPALIRGADVGLVHLRPSPLFETVLPSKLFEYMGCGRPVLMGVAGSAAEIVTESGCGWLFPPGDVDALVALVRRVKEDPAERSIRGKAGRRFVEKFYDRDDLARRYESEVLRPFAKGS